MNAGPNDYLQKLPVRAVAEADIDLLLTEELHTSVDFREWFLSSLREEHLISAEFLGAWRSITTEIGETDVMALFRATKTQEVHAILIENKITATFQERQPERYYERGAEGQRLGTWSTFTVCLVAPQRYLDTNSQVQFDRRLSYESLQDWFAAKATDPRSAFKKQIFVAALQPRIWQRLPDEITTTFFSFYDDLCVREFPNLMLAPKPERSATDYWIYLYRPVGLPKSVYIIHKCDRGYVDLTFPNRTAAELQRTCGRFLDSRMTVHQTGKSAAVRLTAPPIDHKAPFQEQEEQVRAGLEAAEMLRCFAATHAGLFDVSSSTAT